MRRRDFITLLGGAAAAWPLTGRAQPARPVPLVGALMGSFQQSDLAAQSLTAELRRALATLGRKEGSNLQIELRWGAGDTDRIGALAKELVNLRPNAFCAAILAAMRERCASVAPTSSAASWSNSPAKPAT